MKATESIPKTLLAIFINGVLANTAMKILKMVFNCIYGLENKITNVIQLITWKDELVIVVLKKRKIVMREQPQVL